MKEFKIAMLGMVDGNGHPYSWSAMFNGYDKEAMEDFFDLSIEYNAALSAKGKTEELRRLLRDGRIAKEEIDG